MTGSPLADGTRRFNDKRTAKKQAEDRRNLQFRRAELLLKGIMIAFLEGELAEAWPTQVIISVQGVGYLVQIPLSSFDQLPPVGQRVRLLTHLVVREDAHLLFGFANSAERDLFRLLLQHVSGVGPKLALAVLSGMTVSQFKAAVVRGDVAALAKISGVGKKTAERIILELKDRVGVAAAWEVAVTAREDQQVKVNDALLALISLGFKQVEAQKALQEVYDSTKTLNTDDLVRLALKKLA
jgi:holliday junction DNA helicase RuvA